MNKIIKLNIENFDIELYYLYLSSLMRNQLAFKIFHSIMNLQQIKSVEL